MESTRVKEDIKNAGFIIKVSGILFRLWNGLANSWLSN